MPFGFRESSTTNYFTARDHLGSVREVVGSDGTTVASRLAYDPWGKVTETSSGALSDFSYPGHYYDRAMGLALAKYRAYDPNLGRWLSRDPLGLRGGLNLYRYAANDPVRFLDPTGKLPMDGASVDHAIGAIAPDQAAFQEGMLVGAPIGFAFDGLAIAAAEGGAALVGSGAVRWVANTLGVSGAGAALNNASSCSSSLPAADPEVDVAEARAMDLLKLMNRIDNFETSRAFDRFFQANAAGGDIKMTPGMTRDMLLIYRQVAQEAIDANKDTQGVQMLRRDLIDRALEGP